MKAAQMQDSSSHLGLLEAAPCPFPGLHFFWVLLVAVKSEALLFTLLDCDIRNTLSGVTFLEEFGSVGF